jgi:peptide/nickel transport system substrate-binding protein
MLPPGETARVPFCPFTRDPRPDGTWSAPDLARARRLVNRSGTRGDRVTVLGVSDDPHPSLVASRAAARALTTLGYRVRLRVMSHSDYNGLPAAVQASLQVFPFSWYADFPSPATFFQTLLPCRPRPAGTCKQVLSRRTQKALQQEAQGRGDQVALWSAIDRRATRQAFTVPLVNPRSVELTSKRLSGYEYNPLWGFLPAQAAVGS